MVNIVGPCPLSPRDREFHAPTEASLGTTPFAQRESRVHTEARRAAGVSVASFDPATHTPAHNEGEWVAGGPMCGLHGYNKHPVELYNWGARQSDPAPVPAHLGGAHVGPLSDLLHRPREAYEPPPPFPRAQSELLGVLNRHHVVQTGGHGYKNGIMNTKLPEGQISEHAFQYRPGPRVTSSYDWVQYGSAALRSTSGVASTHLPVKAQHYREEQGWTQGADMIGAAEREKQLSAMRLNSMSTDNARYAERQRTSGAVFSRVHNQEEFQPGHGF